MENNTTPPAPPTTPVQTPATPSVEAVPSTPPVQPPSPVTPTASVQTAPRHSGHPVAKIIALVLVAINILLALYIGVMLLGR